VFGWFAWKLTFTPIPTKAWNWVPWEKNHLGIGQDKKKSSVENKNIGKVFRFHGECEN